MTDTTWQYRVLNLWNHLSNKSTIVYISTCNILYSGTHDLRYLSFPDRFLLLLSTFATLKQQLVVLIAWSTSKMSIVQVYALSWTVSVIIVRCVSYVCDRCPEWQWGDVRCQSPRWRPREGLHFRQRAVWGPGSPESDSGHLGPGNHGQGRRRQTWQLGTGELARIVLWLSVLLSDFQLCCFFSFWEW